VFPSGLPSKYYPGPMLLNFSDRTRTGVFNMVWPLTRKVGKNLPLKLKFFSFSLAICHENAISGHCGKFHTKLKNVRCFGFRLIKSVPSGVWSHRGRLRKALAKAHLGRRLGEKSLQFFFPLWASEVLANPCGDQNTSKSGSKNGFREKLKS
jgi:hypothetical protein